MHTAAPYNIFFLLFHEPFAYTHNNGPYYIPILLIRINVYIFLCFFDLYLNSNVSILFLVQGF